MRTVAPHADSYNVCFNTNQAQPRGVAAGSVRPECPLDPENKLYTVPGTSLTFARSCETDYVSNSRFCLFPFLASLGGSKLRSGRTKRNRSVPPCLIVAPYENTDPES